ncbi:hypothetical protein BHE74_00020705 [Ensete ventricosum]|nr:hypothetical protein BHE74_00020705 [Ensete ventricosum]RZS15160.1 hypothetical protein BHM03_00046956 [Ensete ventricosum]
MEMSPEGDMVQRIVVEQFEAIQHTREKSPEGLDHTKRALIMKGAEKVKNAEANSKYQDKAEGQRPRNFKRPWLLIKIAESGDFELMQEYSTKE